MCFLEDKALTFKENRAVGPGDLSSYSGLGNNLEALLLWAPAKASQRGMSAQQGSLPRLPVHMDSVKQRVPISLDHTCLSAKTLQDAPPCMFINLFKVYIHILLY